MHVCGWVWCSGSFSRLCSRIPVAHFCSVVLISLFFPYGSLMPYCCALRFLFMWTPSTTEVAAAVRRAEDVLLVHGVSTETRLGAS